MSGDIEAICGDVQYLFSWGEREICVGMGREINCELQ